jgi:hypothetical protein
MGTGFAYFCHCKNEIWLTIIKTVVVGNFRVN